MTESSSSTSKYYATKTANFRHYNIAARDLYNNIIDLITNSHYAYDTGTENANLSDHKLICVMHRHIPKPKQKLFLQEGSIDYTTEMNFKLPVKI